MREARVLRRRGLPERGSHFMQAPLLPVPGPLHPLTGGAGHVTAPAGIETGNRIGGASVQGADERNGESWIEGVKGTWLHGRSQMTVG